MEIRDPPTSTMAKTGASPQKQPWNTRNLGSRALVDIAAATSAGALVAPVVSSVDRAIIENASGRRSIGESLRDSLRRFLFRPQNFFFSKQYGLILMVYSGTYAAANLLDTTQSTLHDRSPEAVTSGLPKFAATSFSNLSLSLYKDRHFTQMFAQSSSSTPRPVRLPTYLLFTTRDCLTILASFNLPPLLAPRLPDTSHVYPHVSQASLAQFVAPAAMQILSTPIHLLGLDLYNRPSSKRSLVPMGDRLAKISREWGFSCLARMARIVPAFGVGGVVNTKMRQGLMSNL